MMENIPGDTPAMSPPPVPPTGDVDLSGLVIGTASAALQVEGGDRNNDWWEWARGPGHVKDGTTPERAADHWNRWREDNALMESLGLRAARLGVEWARIEPRPGEFDHAVIDRYREEIGDLRDRGIEPLVTLHHFVNPLWLARRGGFTVPEAVGRFDRYARAVVTHLGDLVTDWVTVNEPNVYATQAHLFRQGPPGDRSWGSAMRVLRHMAMSHVRGYELIHELQGDAARVGFAHHARVFAPRNPRNPLHRMAAATSRRMFQDIIAEACLRGRFHPLLGGNRGTGIGKGRHYDYLGLNYYSRSAVDKLDDGTFPGVPVTDLGWEVYPAGLVQCARELVERYDAPVWVTENGVCDNGLPGGGPDGERFRARFILEHLTAIAGSGLPIERWYHWCFTDNWEWDLGEEPRFGLVHLDYGTQRRTPKPSAAMIREILAVGRITPDIHARYAAGQRYPLSPTEGAGA